MRVLAVCAHPDDIEFVCAGTLAKYKRLGHDVHYILFVFNQLYWMRALFNNTETRLDFIELVRKSRPDLIICPNPNCDYHPDHTTAGQIIWDIHVMVTVPNIKTKMPPCEVIPEIVYMDTIGGGNFIPNKYVDITNDIETKRKMLTCHKSQDAWLSDQYGVTCVEMMETFARTRGFQCGCRFAEAFYVPMLYPQKVDKDGLI